LARRENPDDCADFGIGVFNQRVRKQGQVTLGGFAHSQGTFA